MEHNYTKNTFMSQTNSLETKYLKIDEKYLE